MAQLAINGHATRGKEVIEILEMLGGTNSESCWGVFDNRLYTINAFGIIEDKSLRDNSNYQVYTLEQFIEKFPYKVGDKVSSKYLKNYKIDKAEWESCNNRVIYKLKGMGWYSADELQPYKEEIMERKPNLLQQLKEYFDNTPRDVIEKEWYEYDKYNEIGPTVNEYLEYVNKSRQPEYPGTYEECHELMVQWKGCDCNPNPELILCEAPIHDFCKLIVARNIYWKIAGEQMGLGKPWKPDWTTECERKYVIEVYRNNVRTNSQGYSNTILAFPTAEMRDAFYDNFKELITSCKELL